MAKKNSKKTDVCERSSEAENSLLSYLKEINRIPLLSKEEETETARLAAEGNAAAREKLITSNLRFVIMVAKKYQGKGLPLSDLISEGNLGLLNAVKHFNAEKGFRFITYAVWWIRQAIIKSIHEKGRMIRLPSNKSRELANTEDEHEPKQRKIRQIAKGVLSLDDPVSKNGQALTRKDAIQDDSGNSPLEHATHCLLKDEIEYVLSGLEERAAAVIRCRFGLGGRGPMTLKEVGELYQLSRERVRQIENHAMMQLRSSSLGEKLGAYIA